MKKSSFSLALIIAFNVLIIGINLVYGLQVLPGLKLGKTPAVDAMDEYKDVAMKKQNLKTTAIG